MPSQNLSAAARAAKPKQPSKAQLVMEQLKASMEAEKHRPKKEVRSKVQQVQAGTAQVEEREIEELQQSDIHEIAGKFQFLKMNSKLLIILALRIANDKIGFFFFHLI